MLGLYFSSLMYILWQRVRLACRAADRYDKLSDSKVAWKDHVIVPRLVQPSSGDYSTELRDSFMTVTCVYRLVYRTFGTLKRLYATYVIVVSYSLEIFYGIIEGMTPLKIVIFISCVVSAMPLFICQSIGSEVQCFIHRFYHKSKLRNVRNCTKLLVYEYAHQEKTFDCGLFEVDTSLLCTLYDFISLFVFAMIGSPK